jgi:hypothetical protein
MPGGPAMAQKATVMFVAKDIRAGTGAAPMTTVTITEAPLGIEDLLAVTGGARVELDDGTRARIAASRPWWTGPWPTARPSTA